MKALILAGGSGTRLWPLSRSKHPKQFLKLDGEKSLLYQTTKRLISIFKSEDIIIITNEDYKFYVESDLKDLNIKNIILEPKGKNTAPAIALGVRYCIENLRAKEDEAIFLFPSDHIIKPIKKFINYIKKAEKITKDGFLVTFGIVPNKPETGYGYIKSSKKIKNEIYKVDKFVEKPNLKTAEKYLKEKNYYWNAGIFAFSIKTISNELRKNAPKIYKIFNKKFKILLSNFKNMPNISIDYAIAEKSKKVAVVPMDLYWNDIGSWDALNEVMDKDKFDNISIGNVVNIDTKNTFIKGNKRLIATIGIEDCFIIDTPDALLVAKKNKTQKVKDIVNKLKQANKIEANEHITTYRNWGSYTILEEGDRYKIKRIVVNEGAKLSLQMHYHRSEHWVVVSGTAIVTVGEKEISLHENESVYVPKSTKHRLENRGKMPLEIIEVQNGEYLEEDDIVRFDDIYGRDKR